MSTKHTIDWTCDDVSDWLSSIGYENLVYDFIESGIDGPKLLTLGEKELSKFNFNGTKKNFNGFLTDLKNESSKSLFKNSRRLNNNNNNNNNNNFQHKNNKGNKGKNIIGHIDSNDDFYSFGSSATVTKSNNKNDFIFGSVDPQGSSKNNNFFGSSGNNNSNSNNNFFGSSGGSNNKNKNNNNNSFFGSNSGNSNVISESEIKINEKLGAFEFDPSKFSNKTRNNNNKNNNNYNNRYNNKINYNNQEDVNSYNNYSNEISDSNKDLIEQIKFLRDIKALLTKKTVLEKVKEIQYSLPNILSKTNIPDEMISIIIEIFSSKYILENLQYSILCTFFYEMIRSALFQHPSNLIKYLELNQNEEELFVSLRRIFNKIIDLFDIDCVVYIKELIARFRSYYITNFSLSSSDQKDKKSIIKKSKSEMDHFERDKEKNNLKRDENFNKLFELFRQKEEEYEKPKDFRKLPILPEPGELKRSYKDLKPTKEGAYESEYEYLETHFRLIREDLINPFRTSIESFRRNETCSNLYTDVKFRSITTSTISLGYEVTFNYHHDIDWETYPKLIIGSLVALSCDNFHNIHYMIVSNREELGSQKRISLTPYLDSTLSSSNYGGKDKNSFNYFKTEFFENIYIMIESPSFFIAYQHILLSLQQIEDDLLPFKDTLVKCNNKDTREPPKYIKENPNIDFSKVFRDRVIIDGKEAERCNILEKFPDELDELDESQMIAIKQTLTSSLSLILGPPGTGKSFVSRNLFHLIYNNIKEQLGGLDMAPILVLSHTNHALDQFTNHLLQITDKAVRIGTRSKDETIKKIQMNQKLKTSHLSTGFKKRIDLIKQIKESFQKLDSPFEYADFKDIEFEVDFLKIFPSEQEFNQFISPIKNEIQTQILAELKKENDYRNAPECQKNLNLTKINNEPDELRVDKSLVKQKLNERRIDGFYGLIDTDVDGDGEENNASNRDAHHKNKRTLGRIGNLIKLLQFNYGGKISKSNAKEQVLKLSNERRIELYRYWLKLKVEKVFKDIEEYFRHFQIQTNVIEEDQFKARKNLLEKDTELISATITGASRFKKLFETLNIKVVIIEECALSMEGFITAVIPNTVEHLILVGDHNQLKPSCTDHSLLTKFQMDRSIFERIYTNGGRCSELRTQRRMSPSISKFILPVYPKLQNHLSVVERDAKLEEEQQNIIKGCLYNVFFFDHIQNETKADRPNLNSKSNYYEADMVIHFAYYLLNQNYRPEQITILTPYSGQLLLLNGIIEKFKTNKIANKEIVDALCTIEVCTVDQYQGEENDIIIVSLVRNNKENIGGFLGITNRINVMISRARLGLYLFGNQYLLQHMRSNETIWKNMFPLLEEDNQVGVSLPLTCPNHSKTITFVKNSKDFFSYCPDGGCQMSCNQKLKCGHQCKRKCHPNPSQHLCKEPCPNILKCGHQCQKFCGQRCGECQIPTLKTHPKCRHKIKVKCSEIVNEKYQCTRQCENLSNSKKKCKNLCGQPCKFY